MFSFKRSDLFIFLEVIVVVDSIGDFGVDCRRDSDCTQSDPNLRCYSKPGLADFGDKRCQCKYKWKFSAGLCRPPDGWKPDSDEEVSLIKFVKYILRLVSRPRKKPLKLNIL